MKTVLIVLVFFISLNSLAQDPEFPRDEFIMHLRLHSGMVTRFNSTPELFTGGVQLVPQFTVVKNFLRVGAVADVFYTNKKLQGATGITASMKLKTISLKNLGSGGNINLSLDHLWGTGKQRLYGGGINIDLLNKLVVGASLHRDYNLKTWWIQSSVAFRISKLKQIVQP